MEIVIEKRLPETNLGYATFEGKTVKEVLNEIKEFTNGNFISFDKCESFGNNYGPCGAWGIYINGVPYIGTWNGWKNKYNGQYDNCKVEKVKISGGWYCAYDFYIITKDLEKSKKLEKENEALKLKNFNQHLVLNGEIDKLKKALEILKKIFDFEAKKGKYPISDYYFVDYFRASDTELTQQEYELLNEVLK